jgi:hypothetical protein
VGYQRRIRSPKGTGRGYGIQRREKARAKSKEQKRKKIAEENQVTKSEGMESILNRLRTLGNQRFALFPFNEYFNLWLRNLKDTLLEFESSSAISVDEQYARERSQILSKIEIELEEIRHREALNEESLRSISNSKISLERLEGEFTTRRRECEERKDDEIRRLSGNIDSLKDELDHIAKMKTGIFKISKRAKAQREGEATQRLESAQRELTLATEHFIAEQERLREEYEEKVQPLIEQIREQRKGTESQENDSSLEVRRAACEDLANAINALRQRSLAN